MRLLFVADGRSPTTLNWLRYWIEKGHETHLISTYPCNPPSGLTSFHILPVAFGGMAGEKTRAAADSQRKHGPVSRLRGLLRPLRYFLGPLSLPLYRKRFRALVSEIRPDLVHALRIPFEGMLAAVTPPGIPLAISIWGNDITLHAHGSFSMAALTRHTLKRADGLLADTLRDISLGQEWGFSPERPTLIVPGAGGIRLEEMTCSESEQGIEMLFQELPPGPIVVNPRGQRPGSLRQDVFFRAIPLVLEKIPQAVFICPSLATDAECEHWVDALGIRPSTKLWPRLNQNQLWSLFTKALVFVSPSLHDGTPNSLLEAMACGCFPVTGNIESMREWIQTGTNGLLVDATSVRSLADGMITALETPSLRATAKIKNALIIAERAEYWHCMAKVEAFYRGIL